MKQMFFILLGAVFGFIGSLIAEPVQRFFFGPRLRLTFENNVEAYRAPTDIGYPKKADGIYIRLRATNDKPRLAKACRAYLIKIERQTEEGWQDAHFRDSIQLAWSAQRPEAGFVPMDLPFGVSQFVDVLWVFNPLPGMELNELNPRHMHPCLAVSLDTYRNLWSIDDVTYQLSILVSGDGVYPESHKVVVRWNGVWNQIEAHDGGLGQIGFRPMATKIEDQLKKICSNVGRIPLRRWWRAGPG